MTQIEVKMILKNNDEEKKVYFFTNIHCPYFSDDDITDADVYAGKGVADCPDCTAEWTPLFGDEVLESKFQDGHYAYSVVAGGGSGNDVFPPVLYVVDVENAVDFNSVLEP